MIMPSGISLMGLLAGAAGATVLSGIMGYKESATPAAPAPAPAPVVTAPTPMPTALPTPGDAEMLAVSASRSPNSLPPREASTI
jgi:hypothetical protein